MFLSRIRIKSQAFAAQYVLKDAYAFHKLLLQAFPCPPGRVLFRIDKTITDRQEQLAVLIQSQCQPNWNLCQWLEGNEVAPVISYSPRFVDRQQLYFRLRANPTRKKRRNGNENGARERILGGEAQLAWLRRKAESGGFSLNQCRILTEQSLTGLKCSGNHFLSFNSVLFEGTLRISNPLEFRRTVENGIGSGKAFGFGLLSVAIIK